MVRSLGVIALGCVLTLIGLVGGWMAAQQQAAPSADPHAADAQADDAAESQELDKRTLANLGVTVGPAKRSTFVRHRAVQAVIEDRPQNLQPIVSPLGGIVIELKTEAGSSIDADAPIIVLARDPIPRPRPDLTADILKPISEEVHEAVAALRSSIGKLKIVEANLARVRNARKGRSGDALPILRKAEIEYQNEKAALELDRHAAEHELERHGLSEAAIADVAAGKAPPPNAQLWAHTLRVHGLWPKAATAVQQALPEDERHRPWVAAAIGELSANGLATQALADALREHPVLATHFAEVAGLLMQGTPLETITLIGEAGALEATTVLRAPRRVDTWDVQQVLVRPGQRIEAGDVLVKLHDARTMWLRLEPIGDELGFIVQALSRGDKLTAKPLLPDSGPVLKDLQLRRMATFTEAHERGGRAYARAPNERLCPEGVEIACSWQLRVGLRYVVQIPVDRMEKRFVFPVGAVTSRGPDRVVYIQDGETFRAQPVRVEFEDDEWTVVADDGGIFEDDPVVQSGAFALGIALQAGNENADTHGHSH